MIKHLIKIWICCCIICLLSNNNICAQSSAPPENYYISKSHVGVALGVINYGGWMNPKTFTLSQANLSGELMYRYDITDQFHIRATGMLGHLQASNSETTPENRYGSFHTAIFEADVLPEYDFLNMSTNEWHYSFKWTPYIYIGGGFYRLFGYTAKGFTTGNQVNLFGANLRGGIGFKYAVSPGAVLFLEGDTRQFSKSIDFYNHNSSRYYSIMIGGIFSLEKRLYKHYW